MLPAPTHRSGADAALLPIQGIAQMPDITDAEYRQFVRYQSLGTPEELETRVKKIPELEADLKGQRDEIRGLKEQLPKEGFVVVPKEKADALTAYEALGSAADIQKAVQERDTLRQDVASRARKDAFRDAVKALGWPEETVETLLDMKSLDGAVVEVKSEKNEAGKDVQVPYVTLAGEGQQSKPLATFAAETPQLKGLRIGTGNGSTAGTQPRGAVYPPTAHTSSPANRTLGEDEFRRATDQTANYAL